MRLYNGSLIIPGLAVFIGIVTFPLWINQVRAKNLDQFQSKPSPAGMACILPKEQMRAEHMKLLIQWRDEVVREGKRETVTVGGQSMPKSLTNNCMTCHAKFDIGPYKAAATYCVDCHNYAGVTTYCWDCHIDPGQGLSLGLDTK